MTKRLNGISGKVALVTGGASGIGKATALAFAREGASVVIADITDANDTVTSIRNSGGTAAYFNTDVTDSADVELLISNIVSTFGRLDFAHNNAGVMGDVAPTASCTESNWDRVINLNLRAVWLCMKYEITQMLKQGNGAIVNTASIAGIIGIGSGVPAYVASKHAVMGLTKAAALEYGNTIRINAICPGTTLTPLVQNNAAGNPELQEFLAAGAGLPIGRIGKPEEIAEAVVWLCSDSATFVLGHALVVDGGRTL